MTTSEFLSTLNHPDPPSGLSDLLLSLWHDAKGNWKKSHDLISEIESKDAALVHAYLHRKEGDIWNADYWYKRASAKRPSYSLEEEWLQLVKQFISE